MSLDQHLQRVVGREVFVREDCVGHGTAILAFLQPRPDGAAVVGVPICTAPQSTKG